MLDHRNRIWWNKISRETYIIKKLIPWGLESKYSPHMGMKRTSYGNEEEDLNVKWEEICIKCSLDFIKVIIEYNTKKMDDLDKDIEQTQSQL